MRHAWRCIFCGLEFGTEAPDAQALWKTMEHHVEFHPNNNHIEVINITNKELK